MRRSLAAIALFFWAGSTSPSFGQATIFPLLDNGPTHQRINLVFLAEGFTSDQTALFESSATSVMEQMLAVRPYADYRSYFNGFGVFVASNEEGSDHPAQSIDRDTFFESYYDCADIARLICLTNAGRQRVDSVLADVMPGYDIVLVIVNDLIYGGSGGQFSVTSTHPSAPEVAIHEIGHSFAGLSDEYESAGGTPHEGLNSTASTVREEIKWNHWILNSTPVPTPESQEWSDAVGLFEGAVYSATDWFRPKLDCYMRSLGVPFCEVCTEFHVAAVYDLLSPIVSFAPAIDEISATGDTTLSVDVLEPTSHPLQVEWSVNGIAVLNKGYPSDGTANSEFLLSVDDFGAGTHEVTARVTDTTSLVRDSAILPLLTDSTRWTVHLSSEQVLAAPALDMPEDGAEGVSPTTEFSWQAVPLAASYHIQISTDSLFGSDVIDASPITEPSYTPSSSLEYGAVYYWRVRALNLNTTGPWSAVRSLTISLGVDIETDGPNIPHEVALHPNYPDPFSTITHIRFDLVETEFVTVRIYDLQGREIARPVDARLPPGRHIARFDASVLSLPSGVYLYRMQAGAFVSARQFVVVR